MTQILLIAVFVIVIVHNDPAVLEVVEARTGDRDIWLVALAMLGSMASVWLLTHLFVMRCARRLDRRGDAKMAWSAERAVGLSRLLATIVHGVGVYWLGWLVAVRRVVGDLVLIDELIAVLPVVGVFVAGWASLYPIDRRIREAVIIRSLDEGAPIEAYVSLSAHVMSFVRHQLALIGVPIVLVVGWSEVVSLLDGSAHAAALATARVVGALLIFATIPVVMRHVWRTHRLEDGELRRRLVDLCRAHRVRVRELLVWNTHGVLVNGAVMGLIGWMRYVLLSDGLLMGLSRDEVEAVAAHEVGHIRRHHIPWLAASVVVALILCGLAAESIYAAFSIEVGTAWQLAILLGVPLVLAAVIFGWVSRRFEWQADAFAAQHLSGFRRESPGVLVTPEASAAMVGALGAVARLNHIPTTARSWRHGSIATRQARLRNLVGLPADRLAIDRIVTRIKVGIVLGAIVTILVVLDAAEVVHVLPEVG